ncbi:MAG: hypothetical protein Q9199_002868 [Rusavskia elegans]
MHVSSFAFVTAFSSAPAASQRPTKPPLQDNLDNLKSGLVNNIKVTQNTKEKFKADWMPKSLVRPWIMCYHKNSPQPLDALINTISRLPVHTRDFVRHFVSIPSAPKLRLQPRRHPHLLRQTPSTAPPSTSTNPPTLSTSKKPTRIRSALLLRHMAASLRKRFHGPGPPIPRPTRSKTVASNTVVVSFQKNVPGGVEGIKKQSGKIRNQYSRLLLS